MTDKRIRILAGGPARETTSEMYRRNVQCLEAQTLPVDVWHVEDQSAAQDYAVPDTDGHAWSLTAIERVARMRQSFLDRAWAESYDYALLVDTDVMLGPHTVEQLVQVSRGQSVVFGVYWTRWREGQDELPQVWREHPYNMPGEIVDHLLAGEVIKVNGGGACTLIPSWVMECARYWPLVPGVPVRWGEDRHYCIRAACSGVEMLAHGGVRIHHAYRPCDRTPEALDAAIRRLTEPG